MFRVGQSNGSPYISCSEENVKSHGIPNGVPGPHFNLFQGVQTKLSKGRVVRYIISGGCIQTLFGVGVWASHAMSEYGKAFRRLRPRDGAYAFLFRPPIFSTIASVNSIEP